MRFVTIYVVIISRWLFPGSCYSRLTEIVDFSENKAFADKTRFTVYWTHFSNISIFVGNMCLKEPLYGVHDGIACIKTTIFIIGNWRFLSNKNLSDVIIGVSIQFIFLWISRWIILLARLIQISCRSFVYGNLSIFFYYSWE